MDHFVNMQVRTENLVKERYVKIKEMRENLRKYDFYKGLSDNEMLRIW